MMTDRQKEIYNLYIKAYRTNNNVPFKAKRNFKDFEKHPDYFYVVKLDEFFDKYPHLFKLDFFNAPYKIYGDTAKNGMKFYSLKYYSSYKGLTTCVEYYKSILNSNPDEHIPFIKESLKFIANFCVEKDIPVDSYCYHVSVSQHDFLKHLKEHRVSWFVVYALRGAADVFYQMAPDEFHLYFGQNVNLGVIQMKYQTSKVAKDVIEKGLKIIKNYVESQRKK